MTGVARDRGIGTRQKQTLHREETRHEQTSHFYRQPSLTIDTSLLALPLYRERPFMWRLASIHRFLLYLIIPIFIYVYLSLYLCLRVDQGSVDTASWRERVRVRWESKWHLERENRSYHHHHHWRTPMSWRRDRGRLHLHDEGSPLA